MSGKTSASCKKRTRKTRPNVFVHASTTFKAIAFFAPSVEKSKWQEHTVGFGTPGIICGKQRKDGTRRVVFWYNDGDARVYARGDQLMR